MKRIATLAAGIALVAGGLTAMAPAAQAYSNCSSQRSITESGGRSYILPSAGTSIDCTMRQGASGNHVRALQRTLNACYNRTLTVDGIFGAQTRDALKYAQGLARITADAIYGPQTRDHIQWVRYNTGVPVTVCAQR